MPDVSSLLAAFPFRNNGQGAYVAPLFESYSVCCEAGGRLGLPNPLGRWLHRVGAPNHLRRRRGGGIEGGPLRVGARASGASRLPVQAPNLLGGLLCRSEQLLGNAFQEQLCEECPEACALVLALQAQPTLDPQCESGARGWGRDATLHSDPIAAGSSDVLS